jgi:type I restriction enzyme, R subunit
LETVMSHESKVELLREARRLGYRTYLYFIATNDPMISLARVAKRVKGGGHDVPSDRVKDRYRRSLDLLLPAITATNRAYIFDNSGEGRAHTWLAEVTEGRELELKVAQLPPWFTRAVIDKLQPSAPVSQPERATQDRVITLFREELGYRYLGDWSDRSDNSNIDEPLLSASLAKRGYTEAQIKRAIHLLHADADQPQRSLHDNNRAVYTHLRYGIPIKTEAGALHETVHLVDWAHPERNDFAIAEEVTLRGGHERRPDLVLYLNGIAVGVLELKSGHVSVADGIRQLISNQRPEFNAWFFSTVQLVLAGNNSEGLRYGAIGTEEKFFLQWKEDETDNDGYKLDKYLAKLCRKERLLELIHDFVIFDGGRKKLPRAHQYFGVKAAQEHVRRLQGGILWHTQGSGKSIVMVLLAKWILENRPKARVLVVTDRDELDKQIEGVFHGSDQPIYRTSSGRDLMTQLGKPTPRLLCSLVHKFGRRGVKDFEGFIRELGNQPSPAVGELFVFVDECHRTQSGKLHKTMKALLPGAVFIGFTGTPLLKEDRETTREVFGDYIHTYKFGEAVADGVVLDLVYEARDIEQTLGSQDRVDAWFEAKTKGLNDWQKAALREQWGTMQKVLSSRSRMERVVEDIVFDFGVKPRLGSERGNAMLVAASIYEACKYYELFQKTVFRGRCTLVTSYNPQIGDASLEDTGEPVATDKKFIYDTYEVLLKGVPAEGGKSPAEVYEDHAKHLFVHQPANMKLLIVVSKLLTGFDAPSCTYLYIDKSMEDHGLFQAICRTNRLDGDDKDFGYIVDYKDLFNKVENAIAVYTKELDHSAGGASPEVLLQDRLAKGKERLDQALETIALICEPVSPPKTELQFIRYFCGNAEIADDLAAHEPQRMAFYKAVANLVRAYAQIADDLVKAGYDEAKAARIKDAVADQVKLRGTIRQAANETIDLKVFEADMRHLIDTYIEAKEPKKISHFDNLPLLELIVNSGIAEAINQLPDGIKNNPSSVSEVIANNIRSKIIKERLTDPAYYDRMSALLDEILADLRARRIEYAEALKRYATLAKDTQSGKRADTPRQLDTPGKRALYNILIKNPPACLDEAPTHDGTPEEATLRLALNIDATVRRVRHANWRGNQARENVIKEALAPLLAFNDDEIERIFLIIHAHKGDY